MLKETETEETRLFCYIFCFIGNISTGGAGPFPPPGYAYDCNFNAICDIKIFVLFCLFALVFTCQSNTNGSILCDHAKYMILLVKINIVMNSSCNLKL